MVREHTVYEERVSSALRRPMEDPSCRQQDPVGGCRENGVTHLSKVCSEKKDNRVLLLKKWQLRFLASGA